MTTIEHKKPDARQRTSLLSGSLKTALWMVAAIAGFFVLRENWELFAGNWIYLVLLACPLMHFFHGHGGHSSKSNKKDED